MFYVALNSLNKQQHLSSMLFFQYEDLYNKDIQTEKVNEIRDFIPPYYFWSESEV